VPFQGSSPIDASPPILSYTFATAKTCFTSLKASHLELTNNCFFLELVVETAQLDVPTHSVVVVYYSLAAGLFYLLSSQLCSLALLL